MNEEQDDKVHQLLRLIQKSMRDEEPLPQTFYNSLQDNPEYCIDVLKLLPEFKDNNNNDGLIMACFHFIELCLVHLRLAQDYHQRWALKMIDKIQQTLKNLMQTQPTLSYWMPIINLFFDADIPLSDDVKEVYLELLEKTQRSQKKAGDHRDLMQSLLSSDNENSEFEVAELFFAQTNALPDEYFPAFVGELLSYKLPKAINIAALFLFHPRSSVRQLILEDADSLFNGLLLPNESISRLILMRQWLPETQKPFIENLLATQRKMGAGFAEFKPKDLQEILATEMDGSGAQALFFLIKRKKTFQAAGVLIKRDFGIKDTWLSPHLDKEQAKKYAFQGIGDNIILRKINRDYVNKLFSHHLYCEQKNQGVPNIHLIKLQELLGCQWHAKAMDFDAALNELKSEVGELSNEWIEKSLKRSGQWHKTKPFTASWFDESSGIDKLVNQHCSFVDGTKYCEVDAAAKDIIPQYFEAQRQMWFEHFVWFTLWAKPQARYNEYLWKDGFVLATQIQNGAPLKDIPLMQVICEQSILLSIETMENRRTHLS